jgi:CoA-transferase family III
MTTATSVRSIFLLRTLLADLGADVIKVEPPAGDNLRNYPSTLPDECRLFLGTNRSKRSIVIDSKRPEGLDALKRLVHDADVFVHNFRPGVGKRLGIGYEGLAQSHARLIYASLSGYRRQRSHAHAQRLRPGAADDDWHLRRDRHRRESRRRFCVAPWWTTTPRRSGVGVTAALRPRAHRPRSAPGAFRCVAPRCACSRDASFGPKAGARKSIRTLAPRASTLFLRQSKGTSIGRPDMARARGTRC